MDFKEWIILASRFIVILHLQTIVFAQKQKLKFCMVDDTLSYEINNSSAPCLLLVNSKNHRIECTVAIDRVTCLRHLISNEVDFMIAEPEDLMILGMSEAYNSKILVTHELGKLKEDDSSYKKVVIIRKDIENIWHTEKKHLCYPGFEPGLLTRDYFKYFENTLMSRKCEPKKSLLENRLSSISEYFKSACISGPWTIDYQYDHKLKEKYGNLCSQCGNSSTCSIKDRYFGKEGALKCLTSGRGDVTWATLEDVREYLLNNRNQSEFSFLCRDNSKRLLSDEPCIWLEEPKKTIIAVMNASDEFIKFIKNSENMMDIWRLFVKIPRSVDIPKAPIDYLQRSYPEYYSMKDYAKCEPDRAIKWCVSTNLEAQKCTWMSYAAQSHGLEPLIECVQEASRQDCIESVKKGKSDIFAVQPHEDVKATKEGLKKIVHMVTNEGDENITAAVVRKFSNFISLKDLKNHKACFSGYRDFGWNSFIYAMKKLTGNNDWYAKDKEMVSQFFSESCIADLLAKNTIEKDFPKNLYSLCFRLKKRSSSSQSGIRQPRNPSSVVEEFESEDLKPADNAMLNCLNHNGADVAFVNLSSLMEVYPDTIGTIFKLLCLNESMTESDDKEKCYSTRRTLGSLMINENVTEAREDDIYLMLMEIDRLFGVTYQLESRLISIYGPFNGFSGIIFHKDTEYLDSKDCGFSCALNYNEILKDISTPYQSPSTPYQAPSTPYQTPSTPYQTPSTPYQIPSTPYQLPDRANSLKQEVYLLIILLFTYIF